MTLSDTQKNKILLALELGREYVRRVDGTMSFTKPENRLTKPDLDKMDEAIEYMRIFYGK
jgi:hypothetical protein